VALALDYRDVDLRSDHSLKVFRREGRGAPSERGRPRSLGMERIEANPGGGPSRIGTLHEQTPLWGVALEAAEDGSR